MDTPSDNQAFVFFSIGPVQPFIASARSVRDLWTGSFLLAWLTSSAINEAVNSGATLVTPSRPPEWSPTRLRRPSIPNRFIAETPIATAADLAPTLVEAALKAWAELCSDVRTALQPAIQQATNIVASSQAPASVLSASTGWPADWHRLWDAQVGIVAGKPSQRHGPFDIRALVVPKYSLPADMLTEYAERLPATGTDDERHWSVAYNYVWQLAAAAKMIRHVPDYDPAPENGRYPPKCSLLGTYEQMGPATHDESRCFWNALAQALRDDAKRYRGTTVRKEERLCAISLAKRFAWSKHFARNPALGSSEPFQFDDTSSVAASTWLRNANKRGFDLGVAYKTSATDRPPWSGQWLHWPREDFDSDDRSCPEDALNRIERARHASQCGSPPTYYAVLMLDADRMGDMARLKNGRDYQARIAEALAAFADRVPHCVEAPDVDGMLIYAGGDDVLAMLPTISALTCAKSLSAAFNDIWRTHLQTEATVSAGIAIVHYKEDLRFALNQARLAEKTWAKQTGRNRAAITVCRRSGQHSTVIYPWEMTERITSWIEAFIAGASDRWTYALAQQAASLIGTDDEKALEQELARQIGRSDETTRRLFDTSKMANDLCTYTTFIKNSNFDRIPPFGRAFTDFITLCQTASFLARGRYR